MIDREAQLLAKYNHSLDRFAECFKDLMEAEKKIDELIKPCLYEAIQRIELCGASPELTDAVEIVSDLHFALICQDKSARECTIKRLKKTIGAKSDI